ncbi:MAG: FlgD immunoglobulin-like domain containing protein [Candidatus Zhuqueibacterota bacterium]
MQRRKIVGLIRSIQWSDKLTKVLCPLLFVICQTGLSLGGTQHFYPVENTGLNAPVVIQLALINGDTIEVGDEIGLFDGDLCVGATVFNGSFNLVVSSVLQYVTPQGDTLPGAKTGNAMIFKIWQDCSHLEGSATATIAQGGQFGNVFTLVTRLTTTIYRPDIDVQRLAATSIARGGTDDIGEHLIGKAKFVYTIDNTAGTDTLIVTGVTDSNHTNCSNFSVSSSLPFTVANGKIGSLSISFEIDTVGAVSLLMRIYHNDYDENSYSFTIQGTGLTTPTVATVTIDSIKTNRARCEGNIIDGGGGDIASRGVCWGQAANPTTRSSHSSNGSGTGQFFGTITDVSPNTVYHVRAYASNSVITGYGGDSTFCTLSVPPAISNLTCDKSGVISTTTLTFTAVSGFGPGTVQYYRYKFTTNATYSWPGNETQWSSGALLIAIPVANANYYLHVKGYNAVGVENGVLRLGPFLWNGTPIKPVMELNAGARTNEANSVMLNWKNQNSDAHTIEVWAKGFGGYPEYSGSVPATPATPDDANSAGWAKISDTLVTQCIYSPAQRDFYYFAVFVEDLVGHYSAPVVDSTLSYWLGDVNATPDGIVDAADIAILASAYRARQGESFWNAKCDLAPTTDYRRLSRPIPDDVVNFEDLMVFAMNYESGESDCRSDLAQSGEMARVMLTLSARRVSGKLRVDIRLDNNDGLIQGLLISIRYSSDLKLVNVNKGAIWGEDNFFTTIQGMQRFEIHGAVLGTGDAIAKSGTLATIYFTECGEDATVQFGDVVCRTVNNSKVELSCNYTDVPEDELPAIPDAFDLQQNYPNPFNGLTTIRYELPAGEHDVRIGVFDVLGHQVKTLVEKQNQPAGFYQVNWDGRDDSGRAVTSGIYFYRLHTEKETMVRKMVLIE